MTEGEKVDGRRARGIRTRDAIVSAFMDLIAGGDIAPTAQRIADGAGVSVRSVYQHFTDVEGLYADASARTFSRVKAATREVDSRWPLKRRVEEYTANRTTALEMMTPFSRASRLIEPTSTAVRKSRLEMQRWGRDRVAATFATELDKLRGSQRARLLAALDTMSSAEAWEHLRTSGHSVTSARQVVRTGLLALLDSVGN
jgi:TetR/AcrR family transcriptional regulator of autoinduction and epiphytic fitness